MNYDTPNIHEEMRLPEGKTCKDCLWFGKCSWFIGADSRWRQCDWSPSRFTPLTNPDE